MDGKLPIPTFTCMSITVKLVATSAGANITSIKVGTVVVATAIVVDTLIYICKDVKLEPLIREVKVGYQLN